jgi:hypothetical protein
VTPGRSWESTRRPGSLKSLASIGVSKRVIQLKGYVPILPIKQFVKIHLSSMSDRILLHREVLHFILNAVNLIKFPCISPVDPKTRPIGVRPPPRHYIKKKTFSRRSRKPLNHCPTHPQWHCRPCEKDRDLG